MAGNVQTCPHCAGTGTVASQIPGQASLFGTGPVLDAVAGERNRDAAVERVTVAAPPEWLEAAYDAIVAAALRNPVLSTDQAWELMDRWEIEPWHEPRAMSGPVRRAVNDSVWEWTGRFIRTARPQAHRGDIREYRSLIYDGGP